MLSEPLLQIVVVAVLAAVAAWRLRISPWWVLASGAAATGIALLLYSPVAGCDAGDSVGLAFGTAAIVGIGLHVGTALTAVADGVRLAREGARRRAALRVLPLLLGGALAVVTFFVAIFALLSCVE